MITRYVLDMRVEGEDERETATVSIESTSVETFVELVTQVEELFDRLEVTRSAVPVAPGL